MMFASAVFSPLSLSPFIWLSDTGADPSIWTDISGNGRDVSQSSAANQPAIVAGALNGRQVRRFSHTAPSWMARSAVNLSQPATVIFVASTVASRNTNGFFSGNYGALAFYNYIGNTDLYAGAGVTAADTGPFSNSVWTACANGASSEWFRNGVSKSYGQAGSLGIVNLEIGSVWGGNELSGDIAEMLFFSSVLSTTNRRAVEQYLGGKYGIAVS